MQLVEQHVIRKGDGRYEAIEQAAFASKNLYNAANYLIRLQRRMEQRGFPADDSLVILVREAHNAMHKLTTRVHYLGCRSKTGG